MLSIFSKLGDWVSYSLFGFDPTGKIGNALQFFVDDTTKILFLLMTMIYIISFLRAGLDSDRIRTFLKGKSRFAGYVIAAGFGAITPFCSCSSIPLFLGFTSAGIPLGITMSFLITSPMINEVAILLLGSLLGMKFTVLYVVTGIVAGVSGGFFIDLIKAERHLMPIGKKAADFASANSNTKIDRIDSTITMRKRHDFALEEVKSIVKRIWIWVIAGISLGAFLHGFVPDGFIADKLGTGTWWTVPSAVAIGIPLYSNASGVIPVVQSLLAKGLPVGTALAFMMSIVAASLPEFTMLRQVMKPRLLLTFFAMLLVFFTLAGWLFNILF